MLTSAPVNVAPPFSPAPDWNNVPFAVTCARCGHDLHGLTDPKCPACALGFDWRDACPIEQLTCAKCGYHLYGLRETRCPECGEVFDWRLVLLDYRRRQKDLFEYRWREQPVRSLIRTWRRALRPKRFWQSIDIHDPPEAGPLLAAAGVCAGASILLFTFSGALGEVLNAALYDVRSGRAYQVADYVQQFWFAFALPSFPSLVAVGTWWVVTFGSLLLLRQSMTKCRVCDEHVLRVTTYSMSSAIAPAVLFFSVLGLVWVVAIQTVRSDDVYALVLLEFSLSMAMELAPFVLVLAVMSHALWSIRCGYRYYLRMQHSWGVAFASQIIATLAAVIVAFWCGSRTLLRLLV